MTKSLTPAQMVVKIVTRSSWQTLGESAKLDLSGPHHTSSCWSVSKVAGKTTTAAKLALTLRKSNKRSMLVAADTYRPAAITQLEVLGKQLRRPGHSEGTKITFPRSSPCRRAGTRGCVRRGDPGHSRPPQINDDIDDRARANQDDRQARQILLVADR